MKQNLMIGFLIMIFCFLINTFFFLEEKTTESKTKIQQTETAKVINPFFIQDNFLEIESGIEKPFPRNECKKQTKINAINKEENGRASPKKKFKGEPFYNIFENSKAKNNHPERKRKTKLITAAQAGHDQYFE